LTEAIRGMKEFQYVLWPEETHSSPRSMLRASMTSLQAHLQPNNPFGHYKHNNALDNTDVESVDGDFPEATGDDDLQEFSDDWTTVSSASNGASGEYVGISPAIDEEDPQTKEPMHHSITNALISYIMVLTHPQKTSKACDLALECISQLIFRRYVAGRAGGRDDTTGSGSAQRETPIQHRAPNSLLHELIVAVQKCGESSIESIQSHVIECFEAVMNSPKCSVHELSMLLVIRRLYYIYLSTKSESCQQATKVALMDIISKIIRRMEDCPPGQHSLHHTDSYILMKRVVHLSAKELPGVDDDAVTANNFLTRQIFTTASIDPRALNNKLLSLELILLMIECAGDNIQNGDKFVSLIQSQLCVTLLKNCISNNTQVAFTSQRIFLVLVYKFKTHLKDEIQVFMKNIFLRVLESEYSSFPQKAIVLESLRSLCDDTFLLTQLFLNYDCDIEGMNLYQDIVTNLTKLAAKSTQEPSAGADKDIEEELTLGFAAVEVLVITLNTFLKTLGMPAKKHKEMNDTAGQQIRNILELENVGQLLQKKDDEEESEAEEEKVGEHLDDPDIRASIIDQSDTLEKMVNIFDRKRNAEQSFDLGAVKFTLSIKGGLGFFIDNGFVNLNAKEVALFLYENREKIDKTQIGELLGKEPDNRFDKSPDCDAENGGSGFYLQVLHHYVDAMDFSDMEFDEAIRFFLRGFRLPGEAQKIDRIMEMFAASYTKQNPDVFSHADTAFILAFSMIMLNTDLHNPSIKPSRRMTLESFQRNNQGIGENGSDLHDSLLAGIYERIKERPFSLKEDDIARDKAGILKDGGGLFGKTAQKHKQEQFNKEKEEMMTTTVELILQRKGKTLSSDRYVDSVAPADVVKPMFDATRESILGALLEVMEGSFVRQNTLVCLNGFQYAIRISCHSDMPAARDTFVDALAKLTLFDSVEDMNFKHVDAIRTLMHIAVSDGEYLGESWGPVLRCISRVATMRMKAESIKKDVASSALAKKRKSFARRFFRNQQKKPDSELAKNKEALMKLGILESVSDQLIDNVFSSTVNLSARALESFTEQLIALSMAELAEGDGSQVQLMMGMTNAYAEDKITLDTSSDDDLSDDSSLSESTAEGTDGNDETEGKNGKDTDDDNGADTDGNHASSS
jgi:brefeldin A-inhibited guanine nucleotide-exchange protein